MSRDRIWGRSVWLWRGHALLAAACVVLALMSETVSGRVLPIMVIVAQAFLTGYTYLQWREARRIRDEWGIDEDGVWSRA
ncbi:hypothetical protein [uncultured Amnibacterium sp.]|uniref:hypothetical protein n=1 Tax=uncultured Amnibacterium sp. TaxID=1631851 RepID=UPI0035CBA18D